MSTITFNHESATFAAALDIDEKQLEFINSKLMEYCKAMNNDTLKKSEVAEKIVLELSYKELVFISTSFVSLTVDIANEKKAKKRQAMFGSSGFDSLPDSGSLGMQMFKGNLGDFVDFLKNRDKFSSKDDSKEEGDDEDKDSKKDK